MAQPEPFTAWGEYMCAHKVMDEEKERLTRMEAVVGAEGMAKLKDLRVLIIGCGGAGLETAKNLILSNVGGVRIWDPAICKISDMGTNFYMREHHVNDGNTRAECSITNLKTLNPFCDVGMYEGGLAGALGSDKFSAVVVSVALPKKDLFELNEACRSQHIAFVMGLNVGVTASIFSDFGSAHHITDIDGEPTQPLAVFSVEVIKKPACLSISGVKEGEEVIIVTCAGSEGAGSRADVTKIGTDVVEFDSHTGKLEAFNGTKFRIARVELKSPNDAKVNINEASFTNLLMSPMENSTSFWQKQLDTYAAEVEEGKKLRCREIGLLNKVALVATVASGEDTPISDTSAFKEYLVGGMINPVKLVVTKEYKTLAETLEKLPVPNMLNSENAVAGQGIDTHLAFAAVLDFQEEHGRWPGLLNDKDADAVLEIAKSISDKRKDIEGACFAQAINWGFPSGEARDVDALRVRRFARLFQTELTGFCAYLGGAVAQEVLKKSGKFEPIDQWIHHEDQGLVMDASATNNQPMGTRYDHQIAILGKDFQARAASQRVFLVGCGALGCEYLKGLAMMGVGVGIGGLITVTDMDVIETSNLSRQFLFRSSDVGQVKSICGAGVVKKWNPALNVIGIEKRVGGGTMAEGKEEQYFTDEFWEDIDICWNALDNVMARQYTDTQCLIHSKPLLESGTLGTKCNSDVILPFRTKSYNDDDEPEEDQIAMCTLKGAPYLPLHCIEYAKQKMFSEVFEFGPEQYSKFKANSAGFFEDLKDMGDDGERLTALRTVSYFVECQSKGAIDFSACVRISFDQLMADFRNSILAIRTGGDEKEAKGEKVWTGTKRRPQGLDFSPDNAMAMEYLYTASNLYAFVFKLDAVRDRGDFDALVRSLELVQPEFKVGAGDAADEEEEEEVDPEELKTLTESLAKLDTAALQEAQAHDFEKDEDANFHIDFLTIATNIRAWNFEIKESERAHVKVTAGKIIPAMATTTAMVCGLVDIEFCKLVLGLQSISKDKFFNCNINLATGANAFNVFNPVSAMGRDTNLPCMPSYTSWDTIAVDEGDITGSQVVACLKRRFEGLEVIELRDAAGSGAAGANKRLKLDLKDLEEDPLSGVKINHGDDESGNPNIVHARISGPAGSPYAGGDFLVEVAVTDKYPMEAPKVNVVTKMYHVNLNNETPVCPNLVFGGAWEPKTNLRMVLGNLLMIMSDPDPDNDASSVKLKAAMAKDRAAFDAEAAKQTASYADSSQKFTEKKPSAAPLWSFGQDAEQSISSVFLAQHAQSFAAKQAKKKAADPAAFKPDVLPPWPHDYVLVTGEFRHGEKEVDLPRIKVQFRRKETVGAPVGGAAVPMEVVQLEQHAHTTYSPYQCEPLDADREAKVKALSLELDDEPITITDCYKLQSDRAAIYAGILDEEGKPRFSGLEEGAIAVTGTVDGEVVETILNNQLEHCTIMDPIMMVESALPALAEAQFDGGAWTAASAGADTLNTEKSLLFPIFETLITKCPPDCLKGLNRMLQLGPVTTVFARGKGFSLRMPEAELGDWQTVNAKGEIQNLPRPASFVRTWNAESRCYEDFEIQLNGAPSGDADTETWFQEKVIKKLKESPCFGTIEPPVAAPAWIDQFVTCTKVTENLEDGTYVCQDPGTFENKWTKVTHSYNP